MSDKPEVSEYYKRQAKDLTNLLFDKRFLNDELSRESIDWLEDYIGFLFESQSNMSAKCAVLTASLRNKK